MDKAIFQCEQKIFDGAMFLSEDGVANCEDAACVNVLDTSFHQVYAVPRWYVICRGQMGKR